MEKYNRFGAPYYDAFSDSGENFIIWSTTILKPCDSIQRLSPVALNNCFNDIDIVYNSTHEKPNHTNSIKKTLLDSNIIKKASWNSQCFYILSTDVPAFFKYQLAALC